MKNSRSWTWSVAPLTIILRVLYECTNINVVIPLSKTLADLSQCSPFIPSYRRRPRRSAGVRSKFEHENRFMVSGAAWKVTEALIARAVSGLQIRVARTILRSRSYHCSEVVYGGLGPPPMTHWNGKLHVSGRVINDDVNVIWTWCSD